MMKKMKSVFAMILVACMILMTLSACGGTASPNASASQPGSSEAPKDKITLTFAAHFSQSIPLGEIVSKAKGLLEEKSGGRITLEEYYNESLVKQADTFHAVCQGVADIAYVPSQNLAEVPMAGIFKLLYPKGSPDIASMTEIYREALEKTDLQKNLAKYGSMILSVRAYGGKQLHTSKILVKTPEDLKGLNIGANGNDAYFFSAMGAGAVTLSNSDYYSSLSNGLVDGLTNHWVSVTAYKLNEVSKFHTEFGGGIETSAESYLINLDTWNSLSPEDQQIVKEVFTEVGDMAMQYDQGQLEKSRQQCLDEGHTIYTLSDEEMKAFAPYAEKVNEDWIKSASGEGWDAKGAYDLIMSLSDAGK